MSNLKSIINESFTQYAGAVLQSRALVDVRDCLKPSARQIFYCMDKYKYTSDKPYSASTAPVAEAMKHFYIHGDISCLGIIMRAAQPFAMRYPLVDVHGNVGNLMSSGNWAAARYTKSRLSKLSKSLFSDIGKDTISEWRDNFAEDEQYPAVLPSKGFYNIVNGTSGIGIGMASSIPQFNIKDVNEALIKLLWDPTVPFEDIYCAPDFATGAILLNEEQVKESLKNGTGFACKLRAVIEYDAKERCLIATEIPYGVYTNTICGELEAILNDEDNPGIDRFNDLTGKTPLIKIYLTKNANVDRVIKYLYKNTSLQSHYAINMTMLEDGRYPRVFGWKEALLQHLKHEEVVYRRGFEFDLAKINKRIHILDGLLIALANIEEVVAIIKGSTSTATAREKLQEKFLLSDAQAKAILEMKLSRLASLEVKKLENERTDLLLEKEKIEAILNNKELLYKEIETGLRAIATKYGDARRTKVMNIEGEEDEPVEVKSLILNLTNKNNIVISEASSLYVSKKGAAGTKMKLDKDEYIVATTNGKTNDTLLLFTNRGNYYSYDIKYLESNSKIAIEQLIPIQNQEKVCNITNQSSDNKEYVILVTKEGYVKKSLISDLNSKRRQGIKVISLGDKDEIISVLFSNDDNFGILTLKGQFLISTSKDINPVGRVAKGIRGIKLDNDIVISARLVPKDVEDYVFITSNGVIKRVKSTEFTTGSHNTKGSRLLKIGEKDTLKDFLPITNEKNIIIQAEKSQVKIGINTITRVSKKATGSSAIKLNNDNKVIGLITI